MAKPTWIRHKVSSYRSGLEDRISEQLESAGIPFEYETVRIPYVVPASNHKYTPDFILPNGIIIESKGLWETDDRKKHLLIKEAHPDLDIRFVFSSSRTKIYKGSKTTYADVCIKNGWKFADKLIPKEWLKEATNEKSKRALEKLGGN